MTFRALFLSVTLESRARLYKYWSGGRDFVDSTQPRLPRDTILALRNNSNGQEIIKIENISKKKH
jgi:hypothetical protein